MYLKTVLFGLFSVMISLTAFPQREFKMPGDSGIVMKRYVFMLLNEGKKRDQDSIALVNIQEGHMQHIREMAKTGKMIIAGPFDNGGKHRGILIFDVDSISQAIRMEATDPAVLSGRLEMEAIYWYAAKGSKLP